RLQVELQRLRLDAALAREVADLDAVPVRLRRHRTEGAHLVALQPDEADPRRRGERLQPLEGRVRIPQRPELGGHGPEKSRPWVRLAAHPGTRRLARRERGPPPL